MEIDYTYTNTSCGEDMSGHCTDCVNYKDCKASYDRVLRFRSLKEKVDKL